VKQWEERCLLVHHHLFSLQNAEKDKPEGSVFSVTRQEIDNVFGMGDSVK
jgi:hypothetical protein